jgi:sucrose-6F-phosphate phosphohydrolase
MSTRLLICTDLDRTLIPNGPQSESPQARGRFAALVGRPEVTLAYVTGRHRALVQQAMAHYRLPPPDFVIGDVGTTIYRVGPAQAWTPLQDWEAVIAQDWAGADHAGLKRLLVDLPALRLQETSKQNRFKLSYYVPLHVDRNTLAGAIEERLAAAGIRARLIWSIDEPAGVGLLDVLPAGASKRHAIEALMQREGFSLDETLFCGDSGNDIEVLSSPIPAVLVANSQPEVRDLALRLATQAGCVDRLYIARGGFMGMNGNYCAGILEGIAHYHPDAAAWMGLPDTAEAR